MYLIFIIMHLLITDEGLCGLNILYNSSMLYENPIHVDQIHKLYFVYIAMTQSLDHIKQYISTNVHI